MKGKKGEMIKKVYWIREKDVRRNRRRKEGQLSE